MRAITHPSPFLNGSSTAVNDFWLELALALVEGIDFFAEGLMVSGWSQYAVPGLIDQSKTQRTH
jgi:hypothetical protein